MPTQESKDESFKVSSETMGLLRERARVERRTIKAVVEMALENYLKTGPEIH